MTKEEIKEKHVKKYIYDKHNLDECSGFCDGYDVAIKECDTENTALVERVKQLEEDKKELINSLILAKDIIVNVAPFNLTEKELTENAKEGGNWYKIINTLTKHK